ncbi:MAG: hypothetical protein HQ477_09220 [Chloroflexi bacterium]|nr:hypothetical protein [Chloroflexota bacterium]
MYLGKLKRGHVEHYIADQLEKWTPSTAANRFGGLRAFLKWAIEDGEISTESSLMVNMKSPKVPEKQVRVLAPEDISSLLKVCTGKGFEERRDLTNPQIFL